MGGETEGQLGFAKLLLSADSTELKKGIEEAKAHARAMGKTMAEVAEEVGGKGRRILMAQQRIDDMILRATGTATQVQLAEIDKRYGSEIAKAKKKGLEIVGLERARAAEKAAIWQREAEKAGEALQKRAQGEGKVAVAVAGSTQATREGGIQLKSFKDLLKVGGTEARSFAGSLGTLATSGFGAAIAGIAIATKLLGAYINKMNDSRRENAAFLADVHKERRTLRDRNAEIAALESGREDTELDRKRRDIADLMFELEGLQEQRETERKLMGPEFVGGGKVEEYDKKIAAAGVALEIARAELPLIEKKAALEKGRDFDKEIKALNERNRLERDVLVLDEVQEKFKRAHFEIEQRYLELLKDVTVEENRQALLGQQQLEMETLQEKFAKEASERAAKDGEAADRERRESEREAGRAQRALAAETTELEQEILRENARQGGGLLEDKLALLESEQAEELRKFDEHNVELFRKAEEQGLDTAHLEEQFELRREQLLEGHAAAIEETTEGAGAAAAEYGEVAGAAFEEVVKKVDRTRLSLLDLNEAQLDLLNVFRKMDMVMTVNDGRSSLMGNDPVEMMKRGMLPVASGIVQPGPLMFGPAFGTGGGMPKINITNTGNPVRAESARMRMGPSGPELDLIIAELIKRGDSETDAAIQDSYGARRTPR